MGASGLIALIGAFLLVIGAALFLLGVLSALSPGGEVIVTEVGAGAICLLLGAFVTILSED
jgi:hypothetical protein